MDPKLFSVALKLRAIYETLDDTPNGSNEGAVRIVLMTLNKAIASGKCIEMLKYTHKFVSDMADQENFQRPGNSSGGPWRQR